MHPLGGMDLQHGRFLAKMFTKMKELGPVGGHEPGTPPRSTNAVHTFEPNISLIRLILII